MTSSCAGLGSGCSVSSSTGFDVASFLLGYASAKNRNLFDAQTYTETRPPFLQSTALTPSPSAYGVNLLLRDGLPAPPGVTRS